MTSSIICLHDKNDDKNDEKNDSKIILLESTNISIFKQLNKIIKFIYKCIYMFFVTEFSDGYLIVPCFWPAVIFVIIIIIYFLIDVIYFIINKF